MLHTEKPSHLLKAPQPVAAVRLHSSSSNNTAHVQDGPQVEHFEHGRCSRGTALHAPSAAIQHAVLGFIARPDTALQHAVGLKQNFSMLPLPQTAHANVPEHTPAGTLQSGGSSHLCDHIPAQGASVPAVPCAAGPSLQPHTPAAAAARLPCMQLHLHPQGRPSELQRCTQKANSRVRQAWPQIQDILVPSGPGKTTIDNARTPTSQWVQACRQASCVRSLCMCTVYSCCFPMYRLGV
jgi:hypothetical protein